MSDRQLAYYYILTTAPKGKDEVSIQQYRWAFHILNDSFSLLNLMVVYWLNGQYDKVHEYADKCIALALEEGNTLMLAECYSMLGNVYACLNEEVLMMPFYNRAIHLLKNTGWKNRLDEIYYNIGATLLSAEKYEEAMEYLNYIKIKEGFLLFHKKALIQIRQGYMEQAAEYIKLMKTWLQDHDTGEASVQVEKLMYEEALFECEKDFLENPQFINLMEKLMVQLKSDRHKGFVIFYREILKKAYCCQRKYKKALEFCSEIS
jgi:tetratricopeptide (TPR) repeat protein